jgi:hypothetical protein
MPRRPNNGSEEITERLIALTARLLESTPPLLVAGMHTGKVGQGTL